MARIENESEPKSIGIPQFDGEIQNGNFQPVQVLEGGLNRNTVFQLGENGEYLVLRVPKSHEEQATTIEAIAKEYDAIGATEHGISFVLRNSEEQMNFLSQTLAADLHTPVVFDNTESGIVMEYVDGIPLHLYIQNDSQEIDFSIVTDVLAHLHKAHEKGIIFGDRWVKNTMVRPSGDFTELDFDIKLQGDHTTLATFELAQTLFHLIHFAKQNRGEMIDTLTTFYKENSDLLAGHDIKKLDIFLQKQMEYFYNNYLHSLELYEGLIPPGFEINSFRSDLQNIHQSGIRRSA